MLTGLNDKLESMLTKLGDPESRVQQSDVLATIVKSVAVGDRWNIPVEPENEVTKTEGLILENVPGLAKKTVITEQGKHYFCAFTSSRAVITESEEFPVVSIAYPAADYLREFIASEVCDGLMLNPWSDYFVISREQAEKILHAAEKMPDREIRVLRSYQLAPLAVIDTNDILKTWNEGWQGGCNQEDWRLIAYPIMVNGRILLLFEMCDEIYGGKYDSFHVESTYSHYRVLEYGMQDQKMTLLNRYRFQAQNADVATVFLHFGVLSAVISADGGRRYSVLPVIPSDDVGQFNVYGNLHRFAATSLGDLVVAYKNNLRDEDRVPLLVFDENGEIINRIQDEYALYCADINLDADENIWYHMFPSSSIEVLGKDESHRVELSGWDCFALSSDKSRLFLSFEEQEGGSVQYILERDQSGNYTAPVRFDFRPTNEKGEPLEADDCKVFGGCSAMKSWVLLNADGRLFLYDIDECVS